MKHLTILVSFLILSSCGTLDRLQGIEETVPGIGTIGYEKSSMFSKAFQKIGTPNFPEGIPLSFERKNFTKASRTAYKKYLQNVEDSTVTDSTVPKMYFTLTINDYVVVQEGLNHERNTGVKEYLKNDRNVTLLSSISFVPDLATQQLLSMAKMVAVKNTNGRVFLHVQDGLNNSEIDLQSLPIFDFETSSFCWKEDRRGQPTIAILLQNGKSCPKGTEKNSSKVNGTKPYLKL